MPDSAGQLDDDELLRLAHMLAWVRPLTPYPGWRFSSDWDNPATAYRLRRGIWEEARRRRLQVPFTLDWYEPLRFNLYLGNDLSLPLFIGGCIEPNEMAFVARVLQPGMCFIDVGANDGLYALLAARCVGAGGLVWAVEPSRREHQRLSANLALNRLGTVRTFQLALSDLTGEADLHVAGYEHEGQNTLGRFIYEGVEPLHVEHVATRSLDELVAEGGLERIDLIKIDVEGAETSVVRGARRVLREQRPTLLLEASDDALRGQQSSLAELLSTLNEFGYVALCFSESTGRPAAPASGALLSSNIVACPNERAAELTEP